jgi:hypothetical protein
MRVKLYLKLFTATSHEFFAIGVTVMRMFKSRTHLSLQSWATQPVGMTYSAERGEDADMISPPPLLEQFELGLGMWF